MKNLLLIFLFLTTITIAQTDTTYFDKVWKKCEKLDAKFYRTIVKQGELYLVHDMYMKTNTPQMIAYSKMLEPELVYEGKQVKFSETGKKVSEGNYINDKKSGIWTFWEDYENDSLVIDCNVDGTYKNVHLPAGEKNFNSEMNVSYKMETMPFFPGGENALYQFIGKNVKYPQRPKELGISGTVFITFVIEKDGAITDVKVLRGVKNAEECDEEAVRVIKSMPKWSPCVQYGRNVRVQFNLPVKFYLR